MQNQDVSMVVFIGNTGYPPDLTKLRSNNAQKERGGAKICLPLRAKNDNAHSKDANMISIVVMR